MDLIEGIRNGDRDAIKSAYTQDIDYIYGFSLSLTNDHDSALEIANRAFAILFGRIQQGETPENMRKAAAKIAYMEAKKAKAGTAPARESGRAAQTASAVATAAAAKREADARPEIKDHGGETENRKADTPAAADIQGRESSYRAYNIYIEDSSIVKSRRSDAPEGERTQALEEQETTRASGSNTRACTEDPGLRSREENLSGIGNKPGPMPAAARTAKEESVNSVAPDKAGIAIPEPDVMAEQTVQEKPAGRALTGRAKKENRKGAADDKEEIPPVKHPVIRTVIIIFNIILIMALVWAGIAVLQNKGIISTSLDLGYTWFNENIFPLFIIPLT